jgi:hypothetical protein
MHAGAFGSKSLSGGDWCKVSNNARVDAVSELIERGGGTITTPPGANPIRFFLNEDAKAVGLLKQLEQALGATAIVHEGKDERISPNAHTIVEKVRFNGEVHERKYKRPGFVTVLSYSVMV